MKLNILVGSLMLGASLCAPSFGGGLLDRMLGLKGSGCDSACCDTGCSVDPSCGCEMSTCGGGCEPTCGVEISACGNSCDSGCKLGGLLSGRLGGGCAAPTCGCEIVSSCGDSCGAAPTCGCEMAPACGGGCGAAPTCGCEMSVPCGCDSGCSKPRRKPLLELLGKIESKKRAMLSGLSRNSCGCDTGCASACEPSCGVEMGGCAAPTCGCEIASPCGSGCGAAPTCGCEIAASCGGCDSACGPKKCGGLLSKLFQRKNKLGCDTGCDSCGIVAGGCDGGCSSCASSSAAPIAAPIMHSDAAPMPPAPIVDPSAYLQSNRRVVQATSYVR